VRNEVPGSSRRAGRGSSPTWSSTATAAHPLKKSVGDASLLPHGRHVSGCSLRCVGMHRVAANTERLQGRFVHLHRVAANTEWLQGKVCVPSQSGCNYRAAAGQGLCTFAEWLQLQSGCRLRWVGMHRVAENTEQLLNYMQAVAALLRVVADQIVYTRS
jgi:hypothetical protein